MTNTLQIIEHILTDGSKTFDGEMALGVCFVTEKDMRAFVAGLTRLIDQHTNDMLVVDDEVLG
jgi:hypothetical protein